MNSEECYEFIEQRISDLKGNYQSLKNKSNDYGFSALCVKSNFYKNPALDFDDTTINKMMVDGTGDGGVDALLSDPNSDESNLVLVQSKHYQRISSEEIINAINKMVRFYNNMSEGNYEGFNEKVIKRFLDLKAEVGDESKIIFVVYTSAPKNGIRKDKLDKAFNVLLSEPDKYELKVYFGDDISDEIIEAESRRPDVESGKLTIDESDNYLSYNDGEAIIANVSAWSIKELYAKHSLNLLAKNLRYHVTGASIDKAIKESIKNNPGDFWFKNNGITIICDNFDISGREIKLRHFSIVNGGQTTYNLFKCNELNKGNDFYLPCKVIITKGENQDEKNTFALEIAKATNSQKAIKPVDLKANSPEQVRFAGVMRNIGIFYQTKRGEVVPKEYKADYLNTDLAEVGKLCLGAIFQMPGTSRNKPSVIYNQEYYNPIFNSNQDKIARISRELLYIDYYYKNKFLKKFDERNDGLAISELIPFAHNARTICIAFTSLACRYRQENLDENKMKIIFANMRESETSKNCYDVFKDINGIDTLFSKDLFDDKDKLEDALYKLFDAIIKAGRRLYASKKEVDSALNATNYLKKDYNYYSILKNAWDELPDKIENAFRS